MSNADFLPVCERLLRKVDPQVTRPVYLVDVSEVEDTRLHAGDNWIAWTGVFLDLQLQDHLERKGVWAGRGFATLLRLDRLEQGLRFVAGCVLHEYAHHCVDLLVYESCYVDTDDSEVELARREIAELVTTKTAAWMEEPIIVDANNPTWESHELPFVRACCHLSHRANQVFESIRPAHLRFIKPYHWVPMSENQFVNACGDELETDESITQVLTQEPPASLIDLWRMQTDHPS